MWELLKIAKLLKQKHQIQHPFHNLYSFWAPLVFAVAYFIIIGNQHIGKRIVCMSAGSFDREFVESRCWSTGTFTLTQYDHSHLAPGVGQRHRDEEIFTQNFYKYSWIVLGGVCLLFALPHRVWKYVEGGKTHQLCQGLNAENEEARNTNVTKTVQILASKEVGTSSYLTKYFMMSWWSALNPLVALVIIDSSMSGKFKFLGYHFFLDAANDGKINDFYLLFPLGAKCSVSAYGPSGQLQVFDSLCDLPINHLNRAVFPTLWFGLIILLITGVLFTALEMCVNCSTKTAAKARIPKFVIGEEDKLELLQVCDRNTLFLLKQIERNTDPEMYQKVLETFLRIVPFLIVENNPNST